MQRALLPLLPFLVLPACAGDDGVGGGFAGPGGTYVLTWQLGAGRTCATEQLGDIVVTANDEVTNNTVVEMAPCTAGRIELFAGVGSHKLRVKAMGTFGDVADSTSVDGAIPQDGATTMLPPLTLTPTPPMAEVVADVETKDYCGIYPSSNVLVEVTSAGRVYAAFEDCYSGPYGVIVKNVPYGQLSVVAKLRTSNNAVVKTAPAVTVAPQRGQSQVELAFP